MLKFSELSEILDGQILRLSKDQNISTLLTDSRHLVVHPGALFFAIKGDNHDGHQYLDEVLSHNVRNFVVQHSAFQLSSEFTNANVISVRNSVNALQTLAAHHRRQFQIPVLGITGSNAKTIIKEWLFQLLEDRTITKSPKSYNSQIGVPLSVWQLNDTSELAIFEAGVSERSEMGRLAWIIRPTIGIFTNIGTAHDAGFRDAEEKVREKCQLFRDSEKIIYRREHQLVHGIMQTVFEDQVLYSWSTQGDGIINYELLSEGTHTTVRWTFGSPGAAELPFTDAASVENALHCLTFMLLHDYSPEVIHRGIRGLRNIPHRLALREGLNDCYLVDDTYNNDLAGLGIALDFLNQQPHGNEKILILSDIQQASGPTNELYQSVSDLLESYHIDKFIGIGKEISSHAEVFPLESSFFSTTSDFLQWQEGNRFQNQLILVKGAREFAFENIVQALLKKRHGTVLEINLDALASNLNFYKNRLPAGTKIMAMVKAFAYGTGSHEVANLLQYHGVDYLGVAYADEGMELRRQGIETPIMVMNPAPDNFEQILKYNLEPEIYSLDLLRSFQVFCMNQGVSHGIHIKVETGMNRLGFDLSQIKDLAKQLKAYPLTIISVFSHLASSGDPKHRDFSKQQYQKFITATQELEQLTQSQFLKHILNSDGILVYPQYHLDMVRLGIGLYGIGPEKGLRNIGTLKTTISQIKTVPKGDTVGYERMGKVHRDSRIAIISIGYADGFDRRFGNGTGKVIVGDQFAPVVGNVCMDMTMIDVTDCQAEVGDQVFIFNDDYPIQRLSESIGTIPYELLTKISERVKRVYFLE